MYDYRDDEIDALKRELAGLPPRKEIILPEGSFLTLDELVERASNVLDTIKEKQDVK